MVFGGTLTANIAAGAITDPFGNPNASFSGNYTVSGCPPSQYTITPGTATIVPGTVDTGNHTDDGVTTVSLPFSFQLTNQTNTSSTQNFEARLFENDPNLRFDVIIGALNITGADHNYVSGVQGNSAGGFFTQDFCTLAPPQNVSRTYVIPPCITGTPSPTPT